MFGSICDAIHRRKVVRFLYDNEWRVVEPHTFGTDSKGHNALRGYQTNLPGPDNKRKWRLFHSEKMQSFSIQDTEFAGPRDGYKRGDKAFATISCEL